MATYDIGDVVRLGITIQAPNATTGVLELTDPGTLKIRVLKPNGTELDYTYAGATVTRDSLGVYHVDVSVLPADGEVAPDLFGWWYYRSETTGVGQGAQEGNFSVRRTEFSNPL